MSNITSCPDWVWQLFSFSVLVLPLFPALGAIGLFLVMLKIWLSCYRIIVNQPLNWGLGIFSVWLIITSGLAYLPSEAVLGLANFLPFFVLFAALSILINQPQQLRQLAWSLIIPSLPIVILGLGQLWANWDSPQLLESILGWQLVPQGEPPGRMSSVFIYTNFLAVYLAIALILGTGLWLETWQQWQRKSGQNIGWILLVLTVILIGDSVGLILTSSRNAWGIAFLSLIAFAVYAGWRWLVWGVMGATTTIAWASFAPNLGGEWLRKIVPAFLWARLSDRMYPDRPVETLRITQWRFCWDLIQERPITGWGLRNFTPIYESQMNVWFGHPHSLFLMLAAETGLVATLLLLAIMGWIMTKASLLLISWRQSESKSSDRDCTIWFSYLVAFTACILFNLVDVTIFDLRVNTISWIILAAINGVSTSRNVK